MAGGEPPPTGDVLGLLDGLLGRRQAGMEERLRSDMTGHLQGELDALRTQLQADMDKRLGKMAQASQEMEARLQELSREWQRSVQEELQGSWQRATGELQQEVSALRRELAGLRSDQEAMGKHLEAVLEQIKATRADVEAQMPAWISRFLAQPRQDAGTAGLLLQREDLQAELRALELRILAQMREERGLAFTSDILSYKLVNPCFSIIIHPTNVYRSPCDYNVFLDGLYENAPLFNGINFLKLEIDFFHMLPTVGNQRENST